MNYLALVYWVWHCFHSFRDDLSLWVAVIKGQLKDCYYSHSAERSREIHAFRSAQLYKNALLHSRVLIGNLCNHTLENAFISLVHTATVRYFDY